jgi:site-specific DNA-methyltransferase (adenine-specific)
MGSGTTLLAALQNGRLSIGVDIDEDYCKLATNRLCKALSDSSEQLSMFEAKEQQYGKENNSSTRD